MIGPELKLYVRVWRPEPYQRYADTVGAIEMTDTQAVAWLRQLANDIEKDYEA